MKYNRNQDTQEFGFTNHLGGPMNTNYRHNSGVPGNRSDTRAHPNDISFYSAHESSQGMANFRRNGGVTAISVPNQPIFASGYGAPNPRILKM